MQYDPYEPGAGNLEPAMLHLGHTLARESGALRSDVLLPLG